MENFEVCKGYNYPCDCCTRPNCPERKKPYVDVTEVCERYNYPCDCCDKPHCSERKKPYGGD